MEAVLDPFLRFLQLKVAGLWRIHDKYTVRAFTFSERDPWKWECCNYIKRKKSEQLINEENQLESNTEPEIFKTSKTTFRTPKKETQSQQDPPEQKEITLNSQDIEEIIRTLSEMDKKNIRTAIEASTELLKPTKREKRKDWFDNECRKAVQKRKQARMKMLEDNTRERIEQYKKIKKENHKKLN
ncbi:hypothetical protein ILUMI_03656 [Ignelater luminosus]|uniref:Uncharacterized protein n=1 Tax=Ignelater luminosus TaxID=2038154 RepID=A0A8K0GLY9_IGNLU|nr:hypothetical protein ILUMI_03656 [Ignelater luminosus]